MILMAEVCWLLQSCDNNQSWSCDECQFHWSHVLDHVITVWLWKPCLQHSIIIRCKNSGHVISVAFRSTSKREEQNSCALSLNLCDELFPIIAWLLSYGDVNTHSTYFTDHLTWLVLRQNEGIHCKDQITWWFHSLSEMVYICIMDFIVLQMTPKWLDWQIEDQVYQWFQWLQQAKLAFVMTQRSDIITDSSTPGTTTTDQKLNFYSSCTVKCTTQDIL